MASIRRTLLAATDLDRSCRHHALLHRKGSLSSSFSSRGKLQQHHNSWRRWCLLRLLLFFLFGFLFGLFPFADLEDSSFRPQRLSFGSSSSAILTTAADNSGNSYLPRRALGNVALRYRASQIDDARFIKDASNPPPFKLPQDQSGDGKLLLIVTPTYSPAFQRLYLSRLGQTLRLVRPPLLWIVVEMNEATVETADILRGTGVMYRHLVCKKNLTDTKNRGVHQRNTALEHIERHRLDGIVHFTDEDSIYSLELFERLREIRRFGVWPVAMLAQNKNEAILEGPVCNGSQVIGWHTNQKSKRLRRFHVDMSGFAFNSSIIWDTRRWNRPNMDAIQQLDTMNKGLQETTFIEQIVEDESQMEGIPYGCSRIMNWYLPLEAKDLVYPKGWQVSRNSDAVVRLT
ncbi:probable beta-1,4-xylosyltransferase IRX9H [Zingiber officinale]|uniref:probable beta-1,4-xylosyltransferase IRX9H n=1 Tax=Zingiber officinale TaxID=94328 RepID=UPI001C4D7E80|nr:probable beta-1,4-xylosyltransferase IRX9H [Zingiber officinale]